MRREQNPSSLFPLFSDVLSWHLGLSLPVWQRWVWSAEGTWAYMGMLYRTTYLTVPKMACSCKIYLVEVILER